ncbi:uncharacterized protein LOC142323401 [Lycorma delicatula]|uniref:uncharacterized protein LOC142323401 n=1 Tax=Lycorma delicatula TaxID=130591 RepID=UPI003F518C6D
MFSEDLKGMIPTVLDCPRFKAVGDVTRKSRSDSCTTGSSSGGISNISGVSLNDSSSKSAGKHHNSVISDRVQTLSPIPSAGSLSTVKSSGHGQVRKSSFTANVSKRKSNSRLSHQDALGYATLRILHRGRRPLPATVPALSPLSPIELIAFQDLRQMSPLVRPRHSVNKPLMSEFEAHSVKLSHLLSEVGVSPTLPYQSSHSHITCPSGLPTPDDDTAWSGPCYMGICLPQRLAELFPDDDEEPRLPRTAAKETYNRQMTDSNIDPGYY